MHVTFDWFLNLVRPFTKLPASFSVLPVAASLFFSFFAILVQQFQRVGGWPVWSLVWAGFVGFVGRVYWLFGPCFSSSFVVDCIGFLILIRWTVSGFCIGPFHLLTGHFGCFHFTYCGLVESWAVLWSSSFYLLDSGLYYFVDCWISGPVFKFLLGYTIFFCIASWPGRLLWVCFSGPFISVGPFLLGLFGLLIGLVLLPLAGPVILSICWTSLLLSLGLQFRSLLGHWHCCLLAGRVSCWLFLTSTHFLAGWVFFCRFSGFILTSNSW